MNPDDEHLEAFLTTLAAELGLLVSTHPEDHPLVLPHPQEKSPEKPFIQLT